VVDVGVRELRDGLSRHLAAVRSGRTVTVTDHGRPIARIVAVDRPSPLEQPIAEGRVRAPHTRKSAAPAPARGRGLVSDLVSEQRR